MFLRAKLWERKDHTGINFECTKQFVGHTGAIFDVCYIPPNDTYPNGAIATAGADAAV